MMRFLFLGLISMSVQVYANNVIENLKHFNPGTIIKNYTENPKAASLKPGEGQDTLKAAGVKKIQLNQKANALHHQIKMRGKIKANPGSHEMQMAEKIQEQAESDKDGGCYKVKGVCKITFTKKHCQESLQYSSKTCKKKRVVQIKVSQQRVSRHVSSRFQVSKAFKLDQCSKTDKYCKYSDILKISEHCVKLEAKAYIKGRELQIASQPSCQNPEIIVGGLPLQRNYKIIIAVTEYDAIDRFNTKNCDLGLNKNLCFLEKSLCVTPNKTKNINGINITRSCWDMVEHYQCGKISASNCESLLEEGCSQTGSVCQSTKDNLCNLYEQTFSCMSENCEKEREVCFEKRKCAEGQCDKAHIDESHDMGEGVSRLGALAGVASDVAANQVGSGVPAIFTGKNHRCRTLVAHLGNCCGGHARFLNCRDEEKQLAKAIEEKRAFYVGEYCAEKDIICLKHKESWCVFPSKLASIIQIEGRYQQLGINFGGAWGETNAANCRGLTPEELERINFSSLDLSPIEKEMVARMNPPKHGQVSHANQSHIERLNREGRAYD